METGTVLERKVAELASVTTALEELGREIAAFQAHVESESARLMKARGELLKQAVHLEGGIAALKEAASEEAIEDAGTPSV